MVRKSQNNDFKNFDLTNINCFTLKIQAVIDNHVITKAYVDQIHNDNERYRRDLGIDFYNESIDSVKSNLDKFKDNELKNWGSITVNRTASWGNERKKIGRWFNRRGKYSQIKSNTRKLSESFCRGRCS